MKYEFSDAEENVVASGKLKFWLRRIVCAMAMAMAKTKTKAVCIIILVINKTIPEGFF